MKVIEATGSTQGTAMQRKHQNTARGNKRSILYNGEFQKLLASSFQHCSTSNYWHVNSFRPSTSLPQVQVRIPERNWMFRWIQIASLDEASGLATHELRQRCAGSAELVDNGTISWIRFADLHRRVTLNAATANDWFVNVVLIEGNTVNLDTAAYLRRSRANDLWILNGAVAA